MWARHQSLWETFSKVKESYWWKGMYKDVAHFVEMCVTCQM